MSFRGLHRFWVYRYTASRPISSTITATKTKISVTALKTFVVSAIGAVTRTRPRVWEALPVMGAATT